MNHYLKGSEGQLGMVLSCGSSLNTQMLHRLTISRWSTRPLIVIGQVIWRAVRRGKGIPTNACAPTHPPTHPHIHMQNTDMHTHTHINMLNYMHTSTSTYTICFSHKQSKVIPYPIYSSVPACRITKCTILCTTMIPKKYPSSINENYLVHTLQHIKCKWFIRLPKGEGIGVQQMGWIVMHLDSNEAPNISDKDINVFTIASWVSDHPNGGPSPPDETHNRICESHTLSPVKQLHKLARPMWLLTANLCSRDVFPTPVSPIRNTLNTCGVLCNWREYLQAVLYQWHHTLMHVRQTLNT